MGAMPGSFAPEHRSVLGLRGEPVLSVLGWLARLGTRSRFGADFLACTLPDDLAEGSWDGCRPAVATLTCSPADGQGVLR